MADPPLIIAPGGGAPGVPQPIIMGDGETQSIFPDFTPILPPPPIGEGGGPPPPFPPPTPPPIGEVPEGVLVGPAIAPAGVPPSVAGFEQPQFGTGSAAAPPGYFPEFTAPLPTPPPIDFINVLMIGPATPPFKETELSIILDGWGESVPPGAPDEPGPDGRFPRPQLPITVEAPATPVLHPSEEPPPPPSAEPRRRRRKET